MFVELNVIFIGLGILFLVLLLFRYSEKVAPLKSNPNLEEVSNAALYLLSDMSKGVTGTTHYVDGGLKLVGIPEQQIISE